MKWRILHIPSGEFLVNDNYRSPIEYWFKFIAKINLKFFLRENTYIRCEYSNSRDSYEKFNRSEFEIVPVNTRIKFQNKDVEPAIRRRSKAQNQKIEVDKYSCILVN